MKRGVASLGLFAAMILASCVSAGHSSSTAPVAPPAAEAKRPLELGAEPIRFAEYQGATIRAFVEGDPAADTRVLFVHGWSGSGAEFLELERELRRLKPGLLCVCVDLPGSGSSDKPADAVYDVQYFRGAIAAIVEATSTWGLPPGGQAESLTVIGHSLGGHFVADYAARDGRGVDRLGLIAPAGWPGEIGAIPAWAAKNEFTVGSVPAFINEETYLSGHRLMMVVGGGHYPEDAVRYAGRALEEPAAKEALKAVTMRALEHDCVDGVLADIQVPVFLVWGMNDSVLNFSYSEKFLSRLPAGTVFQAYERCGHMPHFERVEELGALIADFIDP